MRENKIVNSFKFILIVLLIVSTPVFSFGEVKKIYYDNGKLKQEINIIDGKQDGITKIYAQDGTLTEERIYNAGKLLNRKQVND
jgi:hypothetical protein